MPYKIVQTIEKGRSVLTSIPDTWENSGILLWPTKQSDKLKRNEKNYPQANWVKSSCIVKRRNLLSYEEAEKEIENMCNYSDTEPFADTENEEPSPPKQKKRHHKIQPTQYFNNEDFNSIAQACLLDKGQTSRSPKALRKDDVLQKVAPAAKSISTSEANFSKPETCTDLIATMSTFLPIDSANTLAVDFDNTAQQPANDGLYYTIEEENPSLTEKIDTIVTQIPLILENQTLIINNQKLLSENQQKIITKIAEISEFVKYCNSSATKESSEQIQFKIISCPDDAEILESKLKDEEYKKNLKNKFSVVCSKGKGLNNAYMLIDLIFTRQFLNQCSWAGGSRKGDSKICFRAYTRIFDFFFDLIRMTDNNFTKVDCTTFFKNILRNSMSRINCKQMRASSSRNRPKMIKPNKLETKVTPDEAPTAFKPSFSEEAQISNSSNEESLC